MYKISEPTDDDWIFIIHEDMTDDSDSFVKFVRAYQSKYSGKIQSVGDLQYKIQNDPLNLTFQWDSCFGNVVIAPKTAEIVAVLHTLESICQELNNDEASLIIQNEK